MILCIENLIADYFCGYFYSLSAVDKMGGGWVVGG